MMKGEGGGGCNNLFRNITENKWLFVSSSDPVEGVKNLKIVKQVLMNITYINEGY